MIRHARKLSILVITILLCYVVYMFAADYMHGHSVDVKSATLQFSHGNATLNADIDYRFSKTALEALENGITLPLEVEVMVKSQREWLWDKAEWYVTLRYQLRYLALSKSYEVINESSGSRREFASRGAAINALGRIRGMPVARSFCSSAKHDCRLLIKVTLDREQLPLPLRPEAYLNLDWYLSSGWRQWPLTS